MWQTTASQPLPLQPLLRKASHMKSIPEAVDLTGTAKLAIDNAYERGHPVTVAYVDELGRPSQSIRGSTQVLSARELGIWARSRDTGLAKAIASNPNVSVLF